MSKPTPRVKLKRLKGSWGKFDPNDGQITLDKQLKPLSRPSKPAVYYHEMYHKYIEDKGVKLKNEEEEEFKCEVYSLMKCKPNELSYLERWLKKQLIKKHGRLSKKKILELKDFSLVEA